MKFSTLVCCLSVVTLSVDREFGLERKLERKTNGSEEESEFNRMSWVALMKIAAAPFKIDSVFVFPSLKILPDFVFRRGSKLSKSRLSSSNLT